MVKLENCFLKIKPQTLFDSFNYFTHSKLCKYKDAIYFIKYTCYESAKFKLYNNYSNVLSNTPNTHKHTHARTHLCMHAHTHARTHTRTCPCMHAHTHAQLLTRLSLV